MKIKTLLCPRLVLAGTVALLAPNIVGQTWQTVAGYPSTLYGAVDALTKDPAGNLYAALSSADAQGRMHALIRKSSDRGASWTVVEDQIGVRRALACAQRRG